MRLILTFVHTRFPFKFILIQFTLTSNSSEPYKRKSKNRVLQTLTVFKTKYHSKCNCIFYYRYFLTWLSARFTISSKPPKKLDIIIQPKTKSMCRITYITNSSAWAGVNVV